VKTFTPKEENIFSNYVLCYFASFSSLLFNYCNYASTVAEPIILQRHCTK